MSKINELIPRMNRGAMMGLLSLCLVMMFFSGFKVWQRVHKHLFETQAAPAQTASTAAPTDKIPAAVPAAQNPPAAKTEPSRVSVEEPKIDKPVLETKKAPAEKKPAAQKIATKKTAAKTAKKATHKNILFQYRDSIPKTVSVVGDFNDWDPEPMTKSKTHAWTLSLQLEPGEYAYNFVVDGRLIRDPSNRKSKSAGQRIASSLITVK